LANKNPPEQYRSTFTGIFTDKTRYVNRSGCALVTRSIGLENSFCQLKAEQKIFFVQI